MAKGLKIPVGVDGTGGSVAIEGDAYADQTIRTALSDHDNDNAFQQDTGLGADMIFGVSNTALRASILRRLYSLFEFFETERLFKLMRETIKWSKGEGELILEFRYVNLESDEEKLFEQSFRTGA